MRLDEYLIALQNCPDEQLKDEWGIYDNWPIFLKFDFDRVVNNFKLSTDYKYEETIKNDDKVNHIFNYVPGTVKLLVRNWIPFNVTTGCGCNNTQKDKDQSQRQLRDYNLSIMLHPYQENKIKGVSWLRVVAMVASDIGQYAIRENIPACMPNTMGWKYNKDYTKIVYHQLVVIKK